MIKIKSKKGITLASLIITVVILLILAVIAIEPFNEDGIVGFAKNTKANYDESEKNYSLLQAIKKAEINSPNSLITVEGLQNALDIEFRSRKSFSYK